jgi:DNA-binding PadR family transcriptional regulator
MFGRHHQHRWHRGRPGRDEGEAGPDREHGFGRYRNHRGGRRSGRAFGHGELRLVVLGLIGEQPRHGYELIKAIEDRFAGSYSPSPGVIYPTLTLLEELGHASVEERDGKKVYSITPEGQAYLDIHRDALNAALGHMDEVRAAHGGGPAPQIVRAMENLKMAVRLRSGRGPLDEDQLHAIAKILDDAATAVDHS